MSEPLLLKKARFFPLGEVPDGADALLIQDGRIAALGLARELSPAVSRGGRVINLRGQTVLPGFIDTHVHLAETGLLHQGVDVSPAETVADVLEMLRGAFPYRSDPGFFRAHSLDPSLMKEDRYPRREELDTISSRVPIFILRRDGHSCVVNTAFLHSCGLLDEKVSGVEMDPHTGRPTGTLRAQALEKARQCRYRLLKRESREGAIRDACRQALRKGVTTVHAICAREEDVDLLNRLAAELPIDVVPYLSSMDVESVLKRGLRQIGGDVLADGSLGSHTAALFQPYTDRPGEHGQLYLERRQLIDFIRRAHQAGLQAAVHAIGDRAIEEVLTAYESVLGQHPNRDHRHRIEHAELLGDDQIERLARSGLVLAVQPAFEAFWGGPGGMYASRLGPQRVRMTNPFRRLVDEGVIIAGGSDSYITPIDPLAGVAAAVNHPHPDHGLTPLEAVRMFTTSGAYLAFQEKEKGLLRAGLKADLVVVSRDPRRTPPEEIATIGISMVIRGGQVAVPETIGPGLPAPAEKK